MLKIMSTQPDYDWYKVLRELFRVVRCQTLPSRICVVISRKGGLKRGDQSGDMVVAVCRSCNS